MHGHLVLTRNKLIETVAFSFSIMGVVASVTSTFSFPLAAGKCYLVGRLWVFWLNCFVHKAVMSGWSGAGSSLARLFFASQHLLLS